MQLTEKYQMNWRVIKGNDVNVCLQAGGVCPVSVCSRQGMWRPLTGRTCVSNAPFRAQMRSKCRASRCPGASNRSVGDSRRRWDVLGCAHRCVFLRLVLTVSLSLSDQVFYYQEKPFPPTEGRFRRKVDWAGDISGRDASVVLRKVPFTFNGTFSCQVKNPPDVHGNVGEVRLQVVSTGERQRSFCFRTAWHFNDLTLGGVDLCKNPLTSVRMLYLISD